MRLDRYNSCHHPGASLLKQVLWYFIGSSILQTRLIPFSGIKSKTLKLFGSKVGKGVVIKPGVRVKYPWKFQVGDHSWIGEGVWIDNVADVRIGSNSCISQDVYICGGDHDFKKETFDLRLRPISIGNSVWIAAKCIIAPGTKVNDGTVLTLGSTATGVLKDNFIYSGNPAIAIRPRKEESYTPATPPKPKKILFINQSYYPDNSATAQYLMDITGDLVNKGYLVTVLCSRNNYLDNKSKHPLNENYMGVNIIRCGAFQFPGKSRAARIVNGILMNFSLLWGMLWLPRFDSVIALTSPPLVAWCACHFLKRPVNKFIYWVMDLNPDQAIAAGWVRSGSLAAKFLECSLRSVLDKSDRVIVLDKQMKRRLDPRTANPSKIEVLPLWINSQLMEKKSPKKNTFRAKHGLEDKFVVMYSGNLSMCHPLNTLLDTAQKLKSDTKVSFVVVGGGPALQEVLNYKVANKLDNLTYLPYQERANLKESLSAADLHLVSLGEKFNGIVHPSKIYGILGVKKPFVLIGPPDSFINEEMVSLNLGQRVSHGDSEGLKEAIHNYREKKTASKVSKEHLNSTIKKFDSVKIFSKLEELL